MEPDDLTDDQQNKNTAQLAIKTDCKLSCYKISLLYTVKKYIFAKVPLIVLFVCFS